MDPLAQLQDIYLPDPIHNYPVAIGWWLLLLAVVVLAGWCIMLLVRFLNKRKAQRTAIARIKNSNLSNSDIINCLKWSCLQYFPREHVASLHGTSLLQFLACQLPSKHQESFKQKMLPLFEAQYTKNSDGENTNIIDTSENSRCALHWLKSALPPHKNTLNNMNNNIYASRSSN